MKINKYNENLRNLISDVSWLINEPRSGLDKQSFYETLFTLGNGFMGSRGILEEKPEGSSPGTFFSGVFDSVGAQVPEIVNAPNPINISINTKDGEKLGIGTMDVKDHMRSLDMRQGALFRRTLYKSTYSGKIDYQSYRFLSIDDPGFGVMRVYLKPIDKNVTISVESSVDTSVTNAGLLTEGRKRHFHISEFTKKGSVNYLQVKTFDKEIFISYASKLKYSLGRKENIVNRRVFELKVPKGKTVAFTQYFYCATSLSVQPAKLRKHVINKLSHSSRKHFTRLIDDNKKAWCDKWRISDIVIKGDEEVQKATRFNIYHMLISGCEDKGRSSIGARTLSGEGYRGHAFWDTEIFLLPFYIYNYPHIAKSLLLYRYNRITKAKELALAKGYKGTLYPWESADTGEETTPEWVKDPDGNIIKIATSLREHHLVADVAYGTHQYIRVTNDMGFAIKYGLEIMLESARFWISRLEFDKKRKDYCINHIIGPDEFHENVNNNVFTNCMAKWNIARALSYVDFLKNKYHKRVNLLLSRLGITYKDLLKWEKMSQNIRNTYPLKEGVIEAFDGFSKLTHIPISFTQGKLLTPFTRQKIESYEDTQLVKQADVVMLMYLLSDKFTTKTKKINYEYYIKRTLHKSSLSPSIHSIIASEIGHRLQGYHYFLLSLFTDLNDVHRNTHEGMHAACLGGVWQVIVNGFAGMRFVSNILYFEPHLPSHWKQLSFTIVWKKRELKVNVTRHHVEFNLMSPIKGDKVVINMFGDLQVIKANVTRSFKRREYGMKAKDIMEKKVIHLKDTLSVKEIADVLTRRKLTGAPVIDSSGKFIGFLSERDMMKAARDIKNFTKKKAVDIMTKKVIVVDPDVSVERIIEIFNSGEFRSIPVIRNKKIVGIILKKAVMERILGEYY